MRKRSDSLLRQTASPPERDAPKGGDAFARLALRDLRIHLKGVHRALRSAVARQAISPLPELAGETDRVCVTPSDAESMLIELDALPNDAPELGALCQPTELEGRQRTELRRTAQAQHGRLPIDRLQSECSLSDFEIDVLLICAATEMDRSYGRLFGYILDDMSRQAPSIELFCRLGHPGLGERLARRDMLGKRGRLRRCGLLHASEDHAMPVRTQLALSDGVLERLTWPGSWRDRFYDSAAIELPEGISLDCFEQKGLLLRLASMLRDGELGLGGVWGDRASGVDDAVFGIAAAAGLPLHKLPLDPARIDDELAAAQTRGALLWIPTDPLADPQAASPGLSATLIERLSRTASPVCLSGASPWRPAPLLAARDYAEVRLHTASGGLRERLWRQAIDSLDDHRARDLAARFRLTPGEVRSVARVAKAHAALCGETDPAARLDDACRQVTQWQGLRFALLVEPRRGADDLILPPDLHRQVLEVARFYRSLLQVDESWGFNRLGHGGGIKVLFTGDSGTGKTLAAEVIAGELGLDLLKIDLSQIVSKWVGETEKNLEIAFREAEASQTLLFFDEADTLFGKRGEVRGGNDRYANLEVGFLLQRLEQFSGLAVLASNLRDEIDQAFIRRFQIVLHFPRPKEEERRALWRMAFPPAAPFSGAIDIDPIVKLDMTGASIVGATRMAALLAADAGSEAISEAHLQEGIRRQYRHESRVLSASAFSGDPHFATRRR
ncbi:MAG: ATP-binding protein [Candidatus Thiodiazotropha sp. (ex Epidulcina cf. delphinae)]|nr:ATP-binding protein [Candidatus Thiodiazotropha sp. (ex Epidulcina cf. delphinae)]